MLDIRLVSIQDAVEGDERSSVQRLQVAFGVDARIARFFLANIPIFVKRNASTEEARAYVQALHQIGAEVEIQRAQKTLATSSADRFQPDAMEKLRAAQRQPDEGPDPFDERPDRFPDSVAPFMDEVPPAFPKSMGIREMTSPPGFDSRLGDDEMEELLSYMPDDDSSIGPLRMDMPDGRSLDAFEAFGLDEHDFDDLGELDAMANLDDEDFPEIEGNVPPPPRAESAGLSAPIPFPDDLLDPVGPDVDPAGIIVKEFGFEK